MTLNFDFELGGTLPPVGHRNAPGNKLVAIIKVKIIRLYKACKCDSGIAIGVYGFAIRSCYFGLYYKLDALL